MTPTIKTWVVGLGVAALLGAAAAVFQAKSKQIISQRWTILDRDLGRDTLSESLSIEVSGRYAVLLGFRKPEATREAVEHVGLSGEWSVLSPDGNVRAGAALDRSLPLKAPPFSTRYKVGEFEGASAEQLTFILETVIDDRVASSQPYLEVSYLASDYQRYYMRAVKWNALALVLGGTALSSIVATAFVAKRRSRSSPPS